MNIEVVPDADDELERLPAREQQAMLNAFEKLRTQGAQLGYPHSSQVQGTVLRELRPRAGRSPWRALYQRIGNQCVIAAITPEAQHDPRGFKRAIVQAGIRLRHYRETR